MAKKSKRTQKHFGAGKMKPPDKINPFEVRINKQRHDVIGRKKKQDRGLPGIARNKAMKKRETTILQEYLLKNKNSKFVDKRIGENVPTLNKEDKIMARFSREMKKRFKKSTMYNLNDDEELTHLGRTIGEIEKFDDPHSESDEEGKLDSDFVKKVHFGGFETDERMLKRTHKERMDDMISESKRRKYEKKMENEVNVDLTEKLDQEWKSVASLLNKSKRIEETTEKSVDDYDIKVRELKFEAKGRPSDRLKSAEEIVAEENEKLRKLEEERIAGMKGNTVKTQNSKHISADDLCDGFALDEDSHSDVNDKTPASKEDDDDDKTNFEKTPSDDDDDDSDNYSDVLSDEASIRVRNDII